MMYIIFNTYLRYCCNADGTSIGRLMQLTGFAVHDELALYVDAGLTPVEALRCATANNARILGLDAEVGKLLPGLVADLAVVSGDPTVEIHLVGSVKITVHRGVEGSLHTPTHNYTHSTITQRDFLRCPFCPKCGGWTPDWWGRGGGGGGGG